MMNVEYPITMSITANTACCANGFSLRPVQSTPKTTAPTKMSVAATVPEEWQTSCLRKDLKVLTVEAR